MKSIHFLFTTLILLIYTCLIWMISPAAPDTVLVTPEGENTEHTGELVPQDRMPVHHIREVQEVNTLLRTRLEQRRTSIDTGVFLLIKHTVNKVSSFYTRTIKLSILLSHQRTGHPSVPPCQYYIFALRRILA